MLGEQRIFTARAGPREQIAEIFLLEFAKMFMFRNSNSENHFIQSQQNEFC